ncbi:hypothetical protein VP01_1133g2 [Puccinia sorghi]|uniref:Phytochrome chromophore attachment site domain-containing protein n=1 Tax=Puccinia sorghi TaxID=27349 RepID=A0A0L6VTI4_9BASI|nr:hypothetical protein VP01_1133g2 [Puccinia sorghi]
MAVGLVRELTGFDRVMIYKFDESWNGQVVAELVDWKRTRDLYRGLRYGRYGQRVTFPTRQFCSMLGDTVSRNIHRLNLSQRNIQFSTDINKTFPDIEYPGGFESISGVLVIPLSRALSKLRAMMMMHLSD